MGSRGQRGPHGLPGPKGSTGEPGLAGQVIQLNSTDVLVTIDLN